MPYIDKAKYDGWATPTWLYRALDSEFGFDLDACATARTKKHHVFFSQVENALLMPWPRSVFCNPPWGFGLEKWIEKACREARVRQARTVMILPARTDPAWFHMALRDAEELRFVKGRVDYVGKDGQAGRAPVGTVINIIGPKGGPPRISSWSVDDIKIGRPPLVIRSKSQCEFCQFPWTYICECCDRRVCEDHIHHDHVFCSRCDEDNQLDWMIGSPCV